MGYNVGAVVSYNNQNYIIIEIIKKEVTAGFIKFLKIKNLINQEILTVDSKNVSPIEIKGSKEKEKTDNQITDTSYIESLFSDVGVKTDTDEMGLFDLSGENSFTLDDIVFESEKNNDLLSEIEEPIHELENNNLPLNEEVFQLPETKVHLTPRRNQNFENPSPISETFRDLQLVGEIQTQTTEIKPSRILNENQNIRNEESNSSFTNEQNPSRVFETDDFKTENIDRPIEEKKEFAPRREEFIKPEVKEFTSRRENVTSHETVEFTSRRENQSRNVNNVKNESIFNSFENTQEQKNAVLDNNPLKDFEPKNTNLLNENDQQKDFIRVERTEASELLDQINARVVEKRMDEKSNILNSEPIEQDFVENLDKVVVEKEILQTKPQKNLTRNLDEKHFDTLETGPLNTRRLFYNFNKQQKIQKSLNEDLENKNTNTLFGVSGEFDKNVLKKSKIYKKFKTMSGWLIALLVLMILTPIAGLFTKAAIQWVNNGTFSINLLFAFDWSATIDLVIIGTSTLMLLVFVVYLVIYLISISEKQYKKIAFYNFQLENKVEIIESIQDYNNETSVYLIKVHNEIKKIKKDIKKINQDKLTPQMSKENDDNRKVSH